MEKLTSFERVVGNVDKNEKENLLKQKEERFSNQQFEELKKMEREKTLKELQIIDLANQCTNEIRRKYGLSEFNIPPKNIHIIKKEEWPQEESAFFSSRNQAVALQEQFASVVFVKKVLHEMLHFKSYNALQVSDNKEKDVNEYRLGLTVTERSGENIYFRNLNEAVTEEMTKAILEKLVDNPLFTEEIRSSLEIIKRHPSAITKNGERLFNEDTIYAEMEKNSNVINTESFTNAKERKILNILIDKLFERNKKIFKNREDVFEIFSKAMITGNILEVGKCIENTFGKGTFRKIGELDGDIEEQEKFVRSL